MTQLINLAHLTKPAQMTQLFHLAQKAKMVFTLTFGSDSSFTQLSCLANHLK